MGHRIGDKSQSEQEREKERAIFRPPSPLSSFY